MATKNTESAKRLKLEIEAKFVDGPKVHPARVNAILQATSAAFEAAVHEQLPGSEMNLSVAAEWGYVLFGSAASSTVVASADATKE